MSRLRDRSNKTPVQKEFARARAFIAKSGNIWTGLSKYKAQSSLGELRRIAPLLLSHPSYRNLIWSDPMPKAFGRITNTGLASYTNFGREVEWCVQTLLPFSQILNEFVNSRRSYDIALLLGDNERSADILDEIEKRFGLSLWILQARINLIQIMEGTSKQREFTRSILSQSSLDNIIKHTITWIGFRSEENISVREFSNLVDENISTRLGYFTLLQVILGICPEIDSEKAGYAVAFTALFPLVDRYVYLISLVQAAVSNARRAEDVSSLNSSISILASKIKDPILHRLMLVIGGSHDAKFDGRILNSLDEYSSGDNISSMRHAIQLLEDVGSIDALQVYLRASERAGLAAQQIDLPENSLIEKIAADLRHVVSFSAEAPEAAARLSKIALTHADAGWASTLALVVRRQSHDERIFQPERQQIYNALRADLENPIFSFCFEKVGASQRYLGLFPNLEAKSPTVAVTSALLGLTTFDKSLALAEGHRQKMQAASALRRGDNANAVLLLREQFSLSRPGFWRYEIGLHLAEALLRADELLGCAEICAEMFLESPYLGSLMPIARLVDALVRADSNSRSISSIYSSLPVVIAFDIYSRYVSPSRDAERADAFKDFLRARGVRHASDLIGMREGISNEQLIYFLRYVCVPEVLDQSLALRSSREVEDERAKILVQLSEMISSEGKPPPQLSEELQAIRTRQVIRDTTHQLDQSKIFVDTDGIRRTLAVQMRENWSRYRLLRIHDIGDSGVEEVYRAIRSVVGDRIQIIALAAPLTEASNLFEKMILEIRDLFASSKVFGLDANLSTNIRHGFILREIRKPFSTAHLVTNKLTESSEYQSNSYWLDRVYLAWSQSHLDASLAKLSRAVDDEIEKLISSILRIKSESSPDGIFAYNLSKRIMVSFRAITADIDELDEFFDFIFDFLWKITEKNLSSAREYLLNSTARRLQTALSALQEEAEACCTYGGDVSALTTAINLVRPEVRSAVERIASWFTISGSREFQDYPIRIAFDSGLAMVGSYYSHLQIEPELEAPQDLLMCGWTLPYLTRFFSILIENVAEHSEIKEGAVAIKCRLELNDSSLSIALINDLAPTIDLPNLQATADRLSAEFGQDQASKFIEREGNSGYPKIWKILTHDLKRECKLTVSIVPGPGFSVNVLLNRYGVVHESSGGRG